ncbi:hypothetical protein F4779DRAFT_632233 [Xylariaceae sp. FL0662B]|nr:hypothetical protein F4779DRAFT_632233 [Xylariaceae sp. FL0662B]
MPNLLSQVFTSKEAIQYGQKLGKLAEKYVQPIAKTVEAFQAAQGLAQLGDTTNKVASLIEKGERLIPSLQIVTESACDKIALLTNFAAVGSAVGFGVHVLQQYQGTQALRLIAARLEDIGDTLEAQTTLMAQQVFPQYVYDMVQERLGATSGKRESHWFFIYHPDTDWYPGFCKLVAEKRLGRRFCGWTNQLDALFLFMMAVRKELGAPGGDQVRDRRRRPIKFHILVPAYQPVIVTDYLSFPSSDSIGDFVIEGKIHNGHPLVWVNIPEDQERFLYDVGNWKPPSPGWVGWLLQSMGMRRKPIEERRELGTVPVPLLDKNHDGEDDEQKQGGAVAAIEDGHESDHASIDEVFSRHSKNARRKGLKTAPRDDRKVTATSEVVYPHRKRKLRQLRKRLNPFSSQEGCQRG